MKLTFLGSRALVALASILFIAAAASSNAAGKDGLPLTYGGELRAEFVGMERTLPNGNIVVVDTLYQEPGAEKLGAVYLYNSKKSILIAMLKGASAGDRIGSDGVEVLPDGNFQISSPQFAGGKGAVTVCDAVVGCHGEVNAFNSRIGENSLAKADQRRESNLVAPTIVFDSVTNVTSFSAPTATRTFIGQTFNLDPAATDFVIKQMDLRSVSLAAVNYTNSRISVALWDTIDTAATPVFSNQVAVYNFDTGAFNAAANVVYNFNSIVLPGSGAVLSSGTNKGIVFNWKGDTGAGLTDTNNLSMAVRSTVAVAVGSVAGYAAPNYGYLRNASGRTDYNFASTDSRNIGANSAVAFRLYNEPAVPTAASVVVAGRVTAGTSNRGVARAVVTLTNSAGETRTAQTNSFGYYRFAQVRAGETYAVNVSHKGYSFTPQVIAVNEEIENLNFSAR